MKDGTQSALDALLAVGTKALVATGQDAREAASRMQAFVAALAPDAAEIVAAASQAAAMGEDVETWMNALDAQLDAVLLNTLYEGGKVSQAAGERVKAAAMAAVLTLVGLAKAVA